MRQFKKIDIHWNGDYVCSTNQSKTCKEAKQRFIETLNDASLLERRIKKMPQYIKVRFAV